MVSKLVPNPDTMHIPKLMFYMYLYGYSTQQIADALTALEKKTYDLSCKGSKGCASFNYWYMVMSSRKA